MIALAGLALLALGLLGLSVLEEGRMKRPPQTWQAYVAERSHGPAQDSQR